MNGKHEGPSALSSDAEIGDREEAWLKEREQRAAEEMREGLKSLELKSLESRYTETLAYASQEVDNILPPEIDPSVKKEIKQLFKLFKPI